MGTGLQPGHRPDAATRLRILRRLQLRQVRSRVSRNSAARVTDLLIGDLFTDQVDVVWQPIESLYPAGKTPPSGWNAGTPAEIAANKANELYLPEGLRP